VKVELDLDIPAELVDADFAKHLKEDAVLRLFADRKLPSGRAAQILGLERMDFLELLKTRSIPAVDYTVEDWEADGRAITEIERRRTDAQAER
jgi:predicted HTH domain antitoxin